jgi:hypothetical protein
MRQQHFLRPRGALLALACLCASYASANSEKHPLPQVEGRILTLNGEAIRTVWGFQVYRVSLYLENRNQNAKSIMEHDKGAKRVRMEMLRGGGKPLPQRRRPREHRAEHVRLRTKAFRV